MPNKLASDRKTQFAWASIAGADAEPVELTEVDGRKGLLTIGCQDPFWLDDESSGVVIYDGNPLDRPTNPETREQRDARDEKYNAKKAAKKAAYEWHREHSKHGPHCIEGECNGKEHTHGWRGSR